MNIFNPTQAKNLMPEIINEIDKGTINKDKINKFFIEFIELLVSEKFSIFNVELFSSLVQAYFHATQTSPAQIKKILHVARIYIDVINNPSVYESRGAILI